MIFRSKHIYDLAFFSKIKTSNYPILINDILNNLSHPCFWTLLIEIVTYQTFFPSARVWIRSKIVFLLIKFWKGQARCNQKVVRTNKTWQVKMSWQTFNLSHSLAALHITCLHEYLSFSVYIPTHTLQYVRVHLKSWTIPCKLLSLLKKFKIIHL